MHLFSSSSLTKHPLVYKRPQCGLAVTYHCLSCQVLVNWRVDLHAWLSLGGRSLGLILASLSLRNGVFGFMSGGCVSLANHMPPTPSQETMRAGGMSRVESTTPCRIKAKKRHIFTFEKSGLQRSSTLRLKNVLLIETLYLLQTKLTAREREIVRVGDSTHVLSAS